jgi:uncharacterized protein YpmB
MNINKETIGLILLVIIIIIVITVSIIYTNKKSNFDNDEKLVNEILEETFMNK